MFMVAWRIWCLLYPRFQAAQHNNSPQMLEGQACGEHEVIASNCERNSFQIWSILHVIPRSVALARGVYARSKRRIVVLWRRVPAPIAAIQADTEPHGLACLGWWRTSWRGVTAVAREWWAQDGADVVANALEGPVGVASSSQGLGNV
jgi:hypothetical protein